MATVPERKTVTLDSEFQNLIKANGLRKRTNTEIYNKFQVLPSLDPYRRLNSSKEYCFFTKPDLQIFTGRGTNILQNHLLNRPLFQYAQRYYNDVLRQLQYSADSTRYPFMNIFSNFKISNLDLPSIQASNDIETSANIHGTKLTYRNTSYTADDGFEFNIDFEDSKYLELYMLLKLYDEYENLKQNGNIKVKSYYVENRIIHDQFSIYKFLVDENNMDIFYWAKFTGVYIKNVPRDAFSDIQDSGGITYSVNFKSQFVEDMKPELLIDFNVVSGNMRINSSGTTSGPNSSLEEYKLYNEKMQTMEPEWASSPYVEFPTSSNNPRPKLKWRK